ncbi:MAG: uroporphyrinogen decarboxylase family protein [Prolixibacteraceae bacterium]|nr:uroporphyrinogen decarboxylase family protein [Prolixibacteraceae bacterium]
MCGNTKHLIPYYRDLNIDILDLDWQVDIDYARKILGKDIIIGGNINPVLVQDKTSDEAFHLSVNLVEKYRGERYLLSAGCEITVLTPPENLKAMYKAASVDTI